MSARHCEANASFSSTTATSSHPMPARLSAISAALTGAIPNTSGSTPAAPRETIRAIGSRAAIRAPSSEASSAAPAPSFYGEELPGYNVKGREVAGAEYFVIGPDKQLDAWEAYLKNAEGADTKLYRLYPRDFWMP